MNDLIEAVGQGKVADVPNSFEKVVESDLAKLFFTGDRVYKIYKPSNNYSLNFSDPKILIKFLEDDWLWNVTLSPEIYHEFRSMRLENSEWKACSKEEAENGIIVMQRITAPNLTELMREQAVALPDLKKITEVMTLRADELTKRLRDHGYPLEADTWQSLLTQLLEQAKPWAKLADPNIPYAWSEGVIDRLIAEAKSSSYLTEFPRSANAAALDCHSDNVFLIDGKPEFLDSMLPKETWRIVDPFCNTSKLAVDITAYYDSDTRDELYAAYAAIHPLPPEDVRRFYEAAYAFLKCIYVGLVGPKDMVPKYKAIVVTE